MSTEVERLKWRRNKILELSSEGHSQHQIASILQIALGTVNRDMQILRQQAKKNIAKYIDDTLPLEYQKCMIGLEAILRKTWDIANNPDSSEREKLQAISVGMQAYNMKIDLLTNATVVQRAVDFVGRNTDKDKGLISQNKEIIIEDDSAEPIQNT